MNKADKPKSLEECVKIHKKLVYYFAHRYKKRAYRFRLGFEDVVQMAYMGLIAAYNDYDPDRKIPFGTYAGMRIPWTMARELDRYGTVISPNVHTNGVMSRVMDFRDQYHVKHGKYPDISEMPYKSEKQRVAHEDAWRFLNTAAREVPLQNPIGDGKIRIQEVIPDTNATRQDDDRLHIMREVKKHIKALPEKKRYVMEQKFGLKGEPKTFQEIGAALGMTRSGAQIHYKYALTWLKKRMKV